ncbi:7-cyano-7-deazaguanine synthase QueC [Rosistilla carotiformis]|uniref:7-cyano-7-deazaguanine synthase n=1 Tax=Rosistilla carotiformis TaxID=2528017 RepID=A0A518JND6_9BACT|nr:7-cyano-7-deazaguanine synthase QueC [Rosistilla carotiformis]QDV67054.1 7-cyano-7-deazaguanine synthase [Rosistilla carotiformis]
MTKPAVVLLSGGLDSATCLAIARRDGFDPHAISFRYGQRHENELDCARRVADHLGVAKHVVVDINLGQFGGSALTSEIAVPKHDSIDQIDDAIPVTYVPARNTVFLSLALAWAETLDARDIYIGVNALDYSGYPDCRPAFIEQFQRLANLATKVGVESADDAIKIHAPLIDLTKAEIIAQGLKLGVDYGLTLSCYDPADGQPCGHCDACLLRNKGFAENDLTDPSLAG